MLRADLLEQFADSRVELRVAARVALAYRTHDEQINRARIQLHQGLVAGRDLYKRDAQERAVYKLHARRVDDPPCGGLADDLAEFHRAIAFREIFRVRERMLVCDKYRRGFKRPLP